MTPELILWIYIILLVVGGVIGYLKAKSQASLIASGAFAAVLALVNADVIVINHLRDILLGALIVVFAIRLSKTKKFMPAGMLMVLTVVTLVLMHVRF